jgi:predicted ATPase
MPIGPGVRLGPYEIVEEIGAGGMGQVFLARDTRLERHVAIKTLPPALAADDVRVRRFAEEARAAAAISHPNIAAVYDVGESGGLNYIALELVEGRTLAAQIAEGPIPLNELLPIAIQLSDAIEAAHARGVIHRDIKPANVMLTPGGHVKVLDFGLARRPALAAGSDQTTGPLSAPGAVLGTIAYMSPEQAMGQAIDHRSDLFSLGVLLYEAVTGRRPFVGQSDVATLGLIAHAEPIAFNTSSDASMTAFERIVRKCLRKRADERYQGARELARDLRELQRDGTVSRLAFEVTARTHNLAEQLTTFVGRRTELDELHQVFSSTRLMTLTGAGGSGKTRLALQFASERLPRTRDGVWFVDLSALSDPGLLAQSIAETLQLGEGPTRSWSDVLVEHVRTREMLLVLDNCEHLVDACADLVTLLLRATAGLRIVATSREALGVPGETVWRVPSLVESEAARLFVERAQAMAALQLTDDTAPMVAEICRRLDGIPLAIELAAARVSVLSVDQINARLKDRFRLLTTGGRTAVARQRTLEAAVGWSYDLLTEPEKRVLCRLSVFAGGWTLAAAEAVGSGDGIDEHEVLDLLGRLVDKSLVTVDDASGSEHRYRLLETIRQYARDRQIESGEIEAVNARHFDYFLTLARRAEPELTRRDQARWLNRLQIEHDNIRSALDWASSVAARARDALQMGASLWWFWVKRGHFHEGQRRLESVLAAAPDPTDVNRATALVGLVHCASFRGDASTASVMPRLFEAAQAAHDPWAEAYGLGFQSILASDRGNFEDAERLAQEALRVADTVEPSHHQRHQPQALSRRMLAYMALQQGDFERSSRLFEESIAIQQAVRELWSLGILLSDLAALRVLQMRYTDARHLAEEAITSSREVGDRRGIAWCLQTIATIEAAEGDPAVAATLYGAALALLDSVGATGQLTMTRVQDRFLAGAIAMLGPEEFEAHVARGKAMPPARALELIQM